MWGYNKSGTLWILQVMAKVHSTIKIHAKGLTIWNAVQKINYESIWGSYDKHFGIGKDDG